MARANLQRIYISVELNDGTYFEDLRVTIADQARYQKTARVNQWQKDNPVQQNSFFAWSSADRQGLTKLTWEEWEAALEDLDAQAVDRDQDTTNQDPTGGSTS